eukprot:COSAG02_NODE_2716_length_8169_cov_30.441293_5_plen_71_part_00
MRVGSRGARRKEESRDSHERSTVYLACKIPARLSLSLHALVGVNVYPPPRYYHNPLLAVCNRIDVPCSLR